MSELTVHTTETAPEASRPLLQSIETNNGFLPNLMGVLAESPATLEAYTTLSKIFDKSDFSAIDRQVVLLTINRLNACHYCMAAHSTIAGRAGMNAETLQALRSGDALPDKRQNALAGFTASVVEKRGWVGEADIAAFLEAGFSKANVLEVILGASLKTISNYVNHIAETPVDPAFEAQTWSKAA
ncbi:carboxymuconolactone decarboxylase family protein [Hyphobacterium sp.]|jgi:uncharacterized peroxidase-related enzyme|uniref:carboxymuconolactone decarboxylase family protein n=1 Tax=Hyphobacterium sp. TaxID=2004662 RepID=UPI003BAB022D